MHFLLPLRKPLWGFLAGALLLTAGVFPEQGQGKDDVGDPKYFQEETGGTPAIEKEFEAERKGKESQPVKTTDTPVKDNVPQKLQNSEKEKSAEEPKAKEGPHRTSSGAGYQGPGYQLDILAAADTLGQWDKESVHPTTNDYRIREAEFGFSAAVDQLASGQILAAAHNESGEVVFELHEAFLYFPTTFIPNTTIKLGHFFYDVGRLNSIHRHDWSFPLAPVAHRELLGEEGATDTGVQFQTLMPWSFWQELSVGVFNGKEFGHSHSEGPSKQNPLLTMHLKQFLPLWWEGWGTQFGFSYLRWNPDANPNRTTQQTGADIIVKWKQGKLASFQWLSEVWYRETRERRANALSPRAPPVETRVGGYSFLEYQLSEQWYAGTRFDYFTDPNRRGALGYTVRNGTAEESVLVTFKPSEFSFFRVQATRSTDIQTGGRDYMAYFQATFIIGKHPAHTY